MLLHWPSGDVYSRFQSQDGCLHLSASLTADLLVASMATILHTHIRFQAVVGVTPKHIVCRSNRVSYWDSV